MKFIVTGGAGFIGSHTVECILSNNHEVIVVDNLSTGQIKNLPEHKNLTFLHKDINYCTANDFPKDIEGIVHLSASASVSDSWQKVLATHHNNLTSTVTVVELCRNIGIRRIVFASSAAVYGNIEKVPINESAAVLPISPYGLHKLFSEEYLSIYAKSMGLSAVALRFFNVFGPRQNPSSQYSGVISKFAYAMKANMPITIHGTGNQSRDFVFVTDVAEVCYKSLIHSVDNHFVSVNIGVGSAVSINQLVECLKIEFPGWNAGLIYSDPQEGDILHSLADTSKAQSLFGFRAKYSLESGLKALVQSL